MSGFVSLPPAGPIAPPAVADEIQIDGFYPSLSIAAARQILRVPTDVTDHRLSDALKAAMLQVAMELLPWRTAREAEGHHTLASAAPGTVGGENTGATLFRRAVHSLAGADLAELQRRLDSAGAADPKLTVLETTVDDHRRNASWAISDLVGRGRATVELI